MNNLLFREMYRRSTAFWCLAAVALALCARAASSQLPAAYIESDGTSYIDTGYTPSPHAAIYADFEYLDTTPQQFIFEAGESSSARDETRRAYFRQYINGGGQYAWALHNNVWKHFGRTAEVGLRCQELVDGHNLTVTFTTPTETKTESYPAASQALNDAKTTLKLFSDFNGTANKAKARIYQIKVYESGELVRDYTPAKRDGFVGFHDSVTGEFICNRSGFTFGGVEDLPEIKDPFIESDGTAGINTGVQCQPGLKVEVDYQLWTTNIVKQWRIVATDVTGDPRLSAYVNGSGNISITSGDTWSNDPCTYIAADTNRHTVVLGDGGTKNHYMIGRTILKSIAAVPYTKRSTVQIGLLATPANYGATFNNKAQARLYRARFWVGERLIRDFQPRTLNGVAGLEDVAQGGFYTAAGLTASANVPEGLTSTPAYVENDGSFFSYVNTYYLANPRTKLEIDYQMLKIEKGKIVCGTYGGSVGATVLLWHNNSYAAYPQAKDGNYSDPKMSPVTYIDSGRHVATLDIPGQSLSIRDLGGTVESEGSCTVTANSNWPILLFTGSKDKYGHPYNGQTATCRIYGAKIWEKAGEEYVLKHAFEPVLKGGIAGFRDSVTGAFHSGDHLTGGGAIASVSDDSYIASEDAKGFFDTGYYATTNTSVWMDYMLLEQRGEQQFPYEAGASNSKGAMYLRAYGNGAVGTGDYSNAFGSNIWLSTSVPCQPNVRVQLFHDTANGRFRVLRDGVELGGANYNAQAVAAVRSKAGLTLKFLCNYEMKANKAKARLYGAKVWENGVLVRDYVPIAQAGKGALYDRVNHTLLNQASASADLAASDDLATQEAWLQAEPREGDAYIESDGTQVLNTGYCGTPTTRFEIDYQMTAIRGQNRPFSVVYGTYSAELYIQGDATGAGNVAFGAGEAWRGQYTSTGADLNRHRALLDVPAHAIGYSGFGLKAATDNGGYTATKTAEAPLALFTKNQKLDFGGWEAKHVTKMRLYAFRIYEANQLVHQYLPYRNGGVIGLYDTVTGNILTKLAAGTAAANEFAYGGEGYGAYDGAPGDLVVKPGDAAIGCGETATLTAYAPGAVGYLWLRNGEEIAGETSGTLAVPWRKHPEAKTDFDRTDVYTVAPVYLIDGKAVTGRAETARVVSNPRGLRVILL